MQLCSAKVLSILSFGNATTCQYPICHSQYHLYVLSNAKLWSPMFALRGGSLCDHETERSHQVARGGQSPAGSFVLNTCSNVGTLAEELTLIQMVTAITMPFYIHTLDAICFENLMLRYQNFTQLCSRCCTHSQLIQHQNQPHS